MAQIRVLEHLACNVELGYRPQRGVGFQTVALASELEDTEDLRSLEEVAPYYRVEAQRSGAELPVKESLFRLPSGRMALTRTVDWGTDPHGRVGNYLWHALVLEHPPAQPWDPFQLLDAAGAGTVGTDLAPRLLPRRVLEVAEPPAELAPLRAPGVPG